MISHAKISRHRRMFKTLTGLSTEGFKQILPSFEKAWEADLDRRDAGRLRLRGRGGGRKGGFRGSADRLVFILVYFRLYPIQAVQGLLFGMSQPQANEWVHRLTPFLNAALGHQQQLPARQPRDLEAVLGECEGLEFIIDGVERPIQRPKNPERQRQFYSGKKKRHSIKNNLIIERRTRKIKGLSTTCEGKKHDKKLADEQALRFPKGSKLWKDTGFQGYEPAGVTTLQAKKKPKGANSAPKRRRPIGVSPRYGCASSTVAPESRSSVASVTFIATSRRALRTPSSKPPADCTISGVTSPSRHGSRRHEARNRNGKTPHRLTRLFAIRSISSSPEVVPVGTGLLCGILNGE